MDAVAKSLGKPERDLLRLTEADRMEELSEDELVDLHRLIRKARNKYVGIYRREGSAKVSAKGGRGLAKEKNRRNALRAEVFEDALSRVSARLAAVAAQTAAELKAQRLAAANPPGDWPGTPAPAGDVVDHRPPRSRRHSRTKQVASARARGARRQAKKDSH